MSCSRGFDNIKIDRWIDKIVNLKHTRITRGGPVMFSAILLRPYQAHSCLPRFSPTLARWASSSVAPSSVIFSGIQPTGVPHIGNYLGALHQWTKIQESTDSSSEFYYSIVDLHAITVPQEARQLRRWKREMLASLLSVGIDPERCAIFFQSTVIQIKD